jgi:hypothetical protein
VDVSLCFHGPNYFGDELCMNKYGSNYYIRMNLNMLVWHYNYLTLDLFHYLILVLTCEYIHGYALNIINIHYSVSNSLLNQTQNETAPFCFHSSTKQKMG